MRIHGGLLARNTALNFIGNLIPALVAVVVIPFIIRGLGAQRFGILALAWVIFNYFALFNMGLGQATTNFVAQILGRGETWRLPTLVWTSLVVHLLLGVAGGVILAALTPWLVEHVFHISTTLIAEARSSFFLLAAAVPVLLINIFLQGLLTAGQRFDLVNAVKIPAISLTYIIPAAGLSLGLDLPGIVFLLVMSMGAAALAYATLSLRTFPILWQAPSIDRKLLRLLLNYGGWVTVSSAAIPVIFYLDRLLIGSFLSITAVAYYTVPSEIVIRLWIIPGSLTATLFSGFSALGGLGEQVKVERILARSLKYLLLLMGPLVLVLIFFAKDILRIWLGNDFAEGSTLPLQILAFGMLMYSLGAVPHVLLQSMGRPDIPAKFNSLQLPLHLGMAWFSIVNFGIVGAALAWTVQVGLIALLLWLAVVRLQRLTCHVFSENGVMRCVRAVVALAVTLSLIGLLESNSLLPRATIAMALLVAFGLTAWHYVLDSTDKRAFIAGIRW